MRIHVLVGSPQKIVVSSGLGCLFFFLLFLFTLFGVVSKRFVVVWALLQVRLICGGYKYAINGLGH